MSVVKSYVIILNASIQTAEKIQEIAGLDSPPEVRDVEKVTKDEEKTSDEDDVQQEGEESKDENHEDEDADEEPQDEEPPSPKHCCIVTGPTVTALLAWSKQHPLSTLPLIIPILATASSDTTSALRTYPVPYFFYGTLSDPSFLASKLDLDRPPVLEKAVLRGWRLKMWGQYKALVEGEEGDVVEGVVFMAKGEEEVQKMAGWMGDRYRVVRVGVERGGEVVEGCSFEFCGDGGQLREVGEDG